MFASVAIDVCKFLNVDEGMITLFETMQASRMGIYVHEGMSGDRVLLRELITNREIAAVSGSGYLGHPGEVWFVRVLPPPFESDVFNYSVVFTTPYVLGKYKSQVEIMTFVEQDWLAYFTRNLPKTRISETE